MPAKSSFTQFVNRHKLAGTLVAIAIGIVTWAWNSNARIVALEQSRDRDSRQDETLKKHWKYLAWTQSEIQKLRQKQGLEFAEPPKLD